MPFTLDIGHQVLTSSYNGLSVLTESTLRASNEPSFTPSLDIPSISMPPDAHMHLHSSGAYGYANSVWGHFFSLLLLL